MTLLVASGFSEMLPGSGGYEDGKEFFHGDLRCYIVDINAIGRVKYQ